MNLYRYIEIKMKEIEVKILEIDRKKIERKLCSLGAKKIFDGIIKSYVFDFKDKRIKKAGNLFRFREMGGRYILTFKDHRQNKKVKICDEYEVEVSDFNEMVNILKSLGIFGKKGMVKRRICYELKGAHFEIDKYLGKHSYIPEFVEIEAKDIKTLYKYVRLLGFQKKDCIPLTGGELKRYYLKKKSS